MTPLEEIAAGARIYLAGRLFDFDEKMKSLRLERAVLRGLGRGAHTTRVGCDLSRSTFLPFRDTRQESATGEHLTRVLFDADEQRLREAAMLVAYIDGMTKDEGVCVEIGWAYAHGLPVILISTDFFEIEIGTRIVPFDPLLVTAATRIIREPRLEGGEPQTFRARVAAAQKRVLTHVTREVQAVAVTPTTRAAKTYAQEAHVYLDFGGELYEWQRRLASQLEETFPHITFMRPQRYTTGDGAVDVRNAARAALAVVGLDGDEAPAGSAFIQGLRWGLRRAVWAYSTKNTRIHGPRGYTSIRNLMLDYSATRTFRTLNDLVRGLNELNTT
jgi:nucleoside 2-deoxyribosyltransferase